MMPWVHASIGAFVGGRVGKAGNAFSAGVVSHGVADLIPHRDYDVHVELPLAALTLAYVWWRHGISSPEMLGALGGLSPDGENMLHRFGFVQRMLFPTHTDHRWFIGHGRSVKSPASQIVIAALCLYAAHRMGAKRR